MNRRWTKTGAPRSRERGAALVEETILMAGITLSLFVIVTICGLRVTSTFETASERIFDVELAAEDDDPFTDRDGGKDGGKGGR